jgi:hypothetical protein
MWGRMLGQAQAHRVWLGDGLQPTVVPNVSKLELTIGEAALEIDPAEAAKLFAAVVAH